MQKRRKAHRRRRLEPYAKAEGAMPFIAEEQERNQSTHAIFLCLRKKSAGCIPFLYASRKRSATISVKKKKHAPLRSHRSEGLKPPLQTSLLRRRLRRRNWLHSQNLCLKLSCITVEINSAWPINFDTDFMSRYNFECRFYTLKQLFDKTIFKLFGTTVELVSGSIQQTVIALFLICLKFKTCIPVG